MLQRTTNRSKQRNKIMAPLTRIIQNHAEEIDCNNMIPPLYFIDDQWLGLTPHPTIATQPKTLKLEEEINFHFDLIQPLGAKDLYTQEEVNAAQRALTFGTERKAVENIITRRAAGMNVNSQGYTVSTYLIQKKSRTSLNPP